ncbi:hypothetical protein HZB04_03940 [Candidatus Wolfebacteria bacterium]|nr:hypothetical protein [Candidatus Wolfebacteria bacterium]
MKNLIFQEWGIIKDKYLRAVFGLSFLLLIFLLAIVFAKLRDISAPLIIHFDVYRGIDFFGGKLEIFGIIATAFIAVVINFLLADFFYWRERFLSYVLGFGSLAFVILILIAVGVIVNIN